MTNHLIYSQQHQKTMQKSQFDTHISIDCKFKYRQFNDEQMSIDCVRVKAVKDGRISTQRISANQQLFNLLCT